VSDAQPWHSGQHHGNSIGVWSHSGGAGDTAMGAWSAALTLALWWERRDRRDGRWWVGGAWLSLPATLVDHLLPGIPRCACAPQRPGCGMATKAARTVSVPGVATPHAVGVLARLVPPLLRGFGLASTSWEPTVRGGCTWPRLGNGWAHGLPRRRVSSGLQTLIVTLATPPAHGRGGEI